MPQVRDFLQRVKCKRFPSIEKDMKMVLAHCGSLFLDPAALCQVNPSRAPRVVGAEFVRAIVPRSTWARKDPGPGMSCFANFA